MAMILDYTPVPELMRFARTSKRMQEMVYEDSRWVKRLQDMGCWNEAEARQRVEASMRKKTEPSHKPATSLDGHAARSTANGVAPAPGRRKNSVAFVNTGWEEQKTSQSNGVPHISQAGNDIDEAALNSPISTTAVGSGNTSLTGVAALHCLDKVRSIRGGARQEYGRIYGSLAPFYFDLVKSDNTTNAKLFRILKDPQHQAKMLAYLRIFAKSDFTLGWHQREEALETATALFENAALREFEQGYRDFDFDGRMKQYAHVLVELNGGAAAIDSYITHHRLMHNNQFGNPLDCIRHAFPGQVNLNPSRDFFQRLALAVNEEVNIIDRVFPPKVDVQIPFLERISEDTITEYVTPLFDEAHSGSIESYLKIVNGVFEQSLQFVSSLRPATGSSIEFPEKSKAIVNRSFEPHVDLYLQEELDFFNAKSNQEVDRWGKELTEREASAESFFMSNVNRGAAKRDFMTSFKKVLMMPVNVLPTMSTAKTTAAPSAEATGDNSRSSTPQPTPLSSDLASLNRRSVSPIPSARTQEAPTTELAAKAAIMNSKLEGISSLFSIEVALTLVHAAKASIERAAHFAFLADTKLAAEAREQCETIYINLLSILGDSHVRPGMDKAVAHLDSYTARQAITHSSADGVRPLVTFLELVNVGDLIQQMLDVFYVQELVAAHLADRDDFLSPSGKAKKRFEQMLDERVAAGLNRGIDVLIDEVEYVCATTQSPTDFNPNTTPGAAPTTLDPTAPTETALQVIALVRGHTGMLAGTTDKNTLDVFNQEVGLRLFTALCKHLKRQRVSVDGAIRLIADTNAYFAFISGLKNKELLQYFGALRELSQLFLVEGAGPKASAKEHAARGKEIAALVADTERYAGIFRAEEVLEFAERRADWLVVRKDVEKAMYGIGCTLM